MQFTDLGLAEPILRSLTSEQYLTPTPIQAQAIPHVMKGGDLLGSAQTGTGKTAAFALPILHELAQSKLETRRGQVRVLVLAPTRELAVQIDESFRTYGRHLHLRHATVFGGVSQSSQERALQRGVDVLVATPGRLLDLVEQRIVDLSIVEVLVLDEADRMLDMGFITDIRKLVARIPKDRQTLMFSATMPRDIRDLAETILRNPVRIEVAPVATTAEKIDQCVYFIERNHKPTLLAHLIKNSAISRALVFTRTKHGADRVVRQLFRANIRAEAIHGNKSQNARQRALQNFKSGKTPILIASDLASRGIDVSDISHVFNYDLTHEPETYVHRIGRTARAGAEGHAISFCDSSERSNLRAIERLIRQSIRIATDAPKFTAEDAKLMAVGRNEDAEDDRSSRSRGQRDGGSRSGGSRSGGGRESSHRDSGPREGARREGGHRESNRGSSHRESGAREFAPRSSAPREGASGQRGDHRRPSAPASSGRNGHPGAKRAVATSSHPQHRAASGNGESRDQSRSEPRAHAPTNHAAKPHRGPATRAKHPLDQRGAKRYTTSHAKH